MIRQKKSGVYALTDTTYNPTWSRFFTFIYESHPPPYDSNFLHIRPLLLLPFTPRRYMSYTQWSTPPAAASSSSSTPQWSHAETKELVAARAELDASFMETKRNRLLWDQISSKLLNSGFRRTPDQCKCKWKNLVTRYKGSEAMDPESARQFPFREELRAIFDARLQRLMSHSSAELEKNIPARSYSDDDDSSILGTAHIAQEDAGKRPKRKRKVGSGSSRGGVVEMLEEFMRRQERMEAEWCKEEEAREVEREAREREWREKMVAMERERLEAVRQWREVEEQRQSREEARAERRDALISALLDRILHGDGGGHRP